MRAKLLVGLAILALPLGLIGALLAVVLIFDRGGGTVSAAPLCGLSGESRQVDLDNLPETPGYDEVQRTNAAIIISTAADLDINAHGAAIGVMTAITESGLRNLANAGDFAYPTGSSVMSRAAWSEAREVAMLSLDYPNDGVASGDWDSIGLFQGRPSAGWGGHGSSADQVRRLLDPVYTSTRFFEALVEIESWEDMEPGAAAQAVQRSAFPNAYARNWDDAEMLTSALTGAQIVTDGECDDESQYPGMVSAEGWTLPVAPGYTLTGRFGDGRSGYTHQGDDFAAPAGTPIFAAADGLVVHTSCSPWQGRSPCTLMIDHGVDDSGQRIMTLYVHMYPEGVLSSVGDEVAAGENIALVGSNGNSTGPHLHFEVWIDGEPVNAATYLTGRGIDV